ncbi:hypothetical protein [Bradyrhizobium sp. USDA 10063]
MPSEGTLAFVLRTEMRRLNAVRRGTLSAATLQSPPSITTQQCQLLGSGCQDFASMYHFEISFLCFSDLGADVFCAAFDAS